MYVIFPGIYRPFQPFRIRDPISYRLPTDRYTLRSDVQREMIFFVYYFLNGLKQAAWFVFLASKIYMFAIGLGRGRSIQLIREHVCDFFPYFPRFSPFRVRVPFPVILSNISSFSREIGRSRISDCKLHHSPFLERGRLRSAILSDGLRGRNSSFYTASVP